MGKQIDVDDDFDFGFSVVSDPEAKVMTGAEIKTETNTKAERMYKMIMPLLNNLMQDAESSEYIHWPNRKEKIESFIERLKTIKDE
jgi:hypothetical protein